MRSNDSSRSSLMPNPPPVSSSTNPCSADRTARAAWIASSPVELVAAEHRDEHLDGLRRRGERLGVVAIRRPLRRQVRTGVAPRVVALRRGDGAQRVAAGASRRGLAHRRGQLAPAADREPAAQVVEPVDVRVERRRADARVRREPGERDGLEALAVRERRGRVDQRLGAQPRARHQAFAIARSIATSGCSTPGRGPAPAAQAPTPAARLRRLRGRAPCRPSPSPRAASAAASSTCTATPPIVVNVSPREQRAVAGVEERDVARRVARGRDDLEAADALDPGRGSGPGATRSSASCPRLLCLAGCGCARRAPRAGTRRPRRAPRAARPPRPMWSPWPCVSTIRRIGTSPAAAMMSLPAPFSVVSTSVKPSSSRTR